MEQIDKFLIPEFKYVDSAYFQINFNITNNTLGELVSSIAFSEKENKLYINIYDGSYKDKKDNGLYVDGKCASEILEEEKDNISRIIISTCDRSGNIVDAKVFSINSVEIIPVSLNYNSIASILLVCSYK